nr:hypothetical protein [Tanacetum cinerariifolium]
MLKFFFSYLGLTPRKTKDGRARTDILGKALMNCAIPDTYAELVFSDNGKETTPGPNTIAGKSSVDTGGFTFGPNTTVPVQIGIPTMNPSSHASYAKLVTGEPSRKHVYFRTLLSPMGNGADGMSRFARAMIELQVDMELKDIIMVDVLKLVCKGFSRFTIRVEYE